MTSSESIRLVIVDDHPVVCRGIELLTETAPDLTVVAKAHDADSGLAAITSYQPDVAIVDLRLPGRLGIDIARSAESVASSTQVILFTAHPDHVALQSPVPRNVRGIVLKDIDEIDLIDMVRRAADGHDIVDQRLANEPSRTSGHPALTAREYEVLRALAAGETNREIAESLGITQNTIKGYLKSLFQKLGARNRVEAVIAAQTDGLL